jgi:hypothetical protein
MANTSRRTGKRAAPGRDGLRARKPGSSKAAKPESRKSNPANKRTSAAAPKAIRKERSDLASVASLRARMTAASRVLELIAGSRSDSQPVFDAIAASARDLTGAMYCSPPSMRKRPLDLADRLVQSRLIGAQNRGRAWVGVVNRGKE